MSAYAILPLNLLWVHLLTLYMRYVYLQMVHRQQTASVAVGDSEEAMVTPDLPQGT